FCGNNLEKILIPESVNLLEGHAFDNNPLNRIVIPSKVVIERYALPEGFVNLYENNSLESGEYELINYNWVRSAEYP
ncbi:MAG: hypothetical protein KDD58_01955, partial [Bdellovibrionales bacterium]|nr:hypothetical protein [Bdellovibrionales bacterium]